MAIYSYDFQNSIRDVTPAMEVIRKNEPTLFATTATGMPIANRNAEWIDKSLGIPFDNVTAVSGLVLTVADGSKYTVGMELSPIDSADNYIVASIAGNDLTVTKAVSGMANPVSGKYEVSFGAVTEGSTDGTEVFWEGTPQLNNTQIFRAEAKLTRTALGTSTYDNANMMQTQVEKALYDVYHAINRALWKGTKKLGSSSVPGRLGGIYQFCTDLKVDANNAKISKNIINKALKKLKDQGGKPNTLICNRCQINNISEIYDSQLILTQDETIRGVYVNKIKNPYDGTVLNVIVDDMCPRGSIWIYDASKIEVCYFTNGGLQDFDSTPAGYDGLKRTVLGELTVKFHNANECFAEIQNVKVEE